MKVIAAVLCLAAAVSAGVVAPATTLVRTPSLDSAVIQSDRVGGNFAYSTVEGHAYAAVSPVVQNVVQPVGVSYTAHQVPVGVAYSAPAAVAAYPYGAYPYAAAYAAPYGIPAGSGVVVA
ncbi:hypothetical protein R5R35_001857 [Gryllus longicercus]|uniref:Cuticular protein n=1 Tax=Gryllus longicercus TaxID=2509291 RepID=A0AAN9VRB5_9ORTH